MKKLFLLVLMILTIQITLSQTVKTPTGVDVSIIRHHTKEFTDAEIAIRDAAWEVEIGNHPQWNAVIIGHCSNVYNCHGYAWHLSDGGDSAYTLNPLPYFNTSPIPYVLTDEADEGDILQKIHYSDGDHSAITTTNPQYLISKWGQGPLVRHTIESCPYTYTNLHYYEIPQKGENSVHKRNNITDTTLSITGATYSWSGDYYICACSSCTESNYIARIVGLNETPTGPPPTYGKIQVEITSPLSGTTVKGLKKFTVTSPQYNPYVSYAYGYSRLVCSSGGWFYVFSKPLYAPIYWTDGPYLTRISAQGSNGCEFEATGDGPSWVKATLYYPDCSIPLNQFTVWAGKPILNVSGPYEGETYNYYTFYANPGSYSYPNDYQWYINPGTGTIYDYGQSADGYFYAEDTYQVVSRAKNECDNGQWGNWSAHYIDIYDGYRFSMAPNPASEFVTITVNKPIPKDNVLIDKTSENNINTIHTIRIFESTSGELRYSTIRTGQNFTIPVSNLQDGSYIVQINYGNKSSALQLTVKH